MGNPARRPPDDEWWARLAHTFATHVREEVAVLGSYEQLAETTEDEGTRFVIELILADERKHHDIFERLSAAARGEPGPGIPALPSPPPQQQADLVAASRRLLAIERDDARSLRRLRRELSPIAHDTMWRLLVDMMELDTTKHIRLLEYLVGRLGHHKGPAC
jgi:rubrerythrin